MRGQSPEWYEMIQKLMANRFTSDLTNRDACIAAYERHNAEVRATISPDRLIEWRTGDGWEPICSRLGLPVPEEPFPKANTREEFIGRNI